MASSQMRSLPHRLERGAWRLEAKTTAWILLVLTLLGLLGWLCLTQASQVSMARYHLWEKETEKARLQRQNAELLAEIAEMLSVSCLEAKARDSGYTLAEGLRYLCVLDYPADSASRGGLAAVARPVEGTVVSLEEHEDKSLGVTRWWEEVISQFVAWAGAQP
ncbi:MAG: hypothetical protein WBW48_08720 [Anaerolineae bacterium]